MSLSETTKKVLRKRVLELRVTYRVARERWRVTKEELIEAHRACQTIRNEIQMLQIDCGDATDIDPTFPGDDQHFVPLKGISCGDKTCTLYRNPNGGCDVCGAPCL